MHSITGCDDCYWNEGREVQFQEEHGGHPDGMSVNFRSDASAILRRAAPLNESAGKIAPRITIRKLVKSGFPVLSLNFCAGMRLAGVK